MTTRYELYIDPSTNVSELRRRLFERALSHPPPFDIARWLMPYRTPHGRHICIVINHSNRNVSVVDRDIASHVLRTAILGFQSHRLAEPVRIRRRMPVLIRRMPVLIHSHTASNSRNVDTGKQCPICFESIMSHDLTTLPCAHSFHSACIGQWLERTQNCPLCRQPLT